MVVDYPKTNNYSNKVEIQVKDEHGNAVKDTFGNDLTKSILVIRDQAKKEVLIDNQRQKSNHGYKAKKDQFKDKVDAVLI